MLASLDGELIGVGALETLDEENRFLGRLCLLEKDGHALTANDLSFLLVTSFLSAFALSHWRRASTVVLTNSMWCMFVASLAVSVLVSWDYYHTTVTVGLTTLCVSSVLNAVLYFSFSTLTQTKLYILASLSLVNLTVTSPLAFSENSPELTSFLK